MRCRLDTRGLLRDRIQGQVDNLVPYNMVGVVGKDMAGKVERGWHARGFGIKGLQRPGKHVRYDVHGEHTWSNQA